MPRFTLFSGVVILSLCFSIASAQEVPPPPRPLQATPDVLKLVDETRRVIDGAPREAKVTVLFQLLSLQLRFEDKAPARSTIRSILELLPTIDKELTQQQLLETIVYTLGDIGDYDDALKTADRIAKVSSRANVYLTVAEKILEENEEKKPEKPFDVLPVIQKAVAGAVEANNAGLEAVARAVLGRELARQGKTDEAKAAFLDARKKAREIEAVEERNVVAMIVRSEIRCGMIPEALAMLETVTDEEMKQGITGFAAVILLQEGKNDEADQLLAALKPGDIKDNVLMGIARETAETISMEKIRELVGRLSDPERKEQFIQNTIQALLGHDRTELAAELAGQSENAARIQTELNVRQLELRLGEKKFDEAQKLVEGFEDPQVKQAATRYVLMARLKEGNAEEVQKLAEATFSEAEKQQIEQLRKEIEKTAAIAAPEERMSALTEIMQAQFGLFDIFGARKTLDLMLQTTETLSDPVMVIAYRLELSPIQLQLSDHAGIRKNLGRLLEYMNGIKDLKKLEKLVPDPETDAPEEGEDAPALVLKKPVDEEDVKSRLFEIYFAVAGMLGSAEDVPAAKISLQKAKELAEHDTDAAKKAEMMLLLSQALAELETPETDKK